MGHRGHLNQQAKKCGGRLNKGKINKPLVRDVNWINDIPLCPHYDPFIVQVKDVLFCTPHPKHHVLFHLCHASGDRPSCLSVPKKKTKRSESFGWRIRSRGLQMSLQTLGTTANHGSRLLQLGGQSPAWMGLAVASPVQAPTWHGIAQDLYASTYCGGPNNGRICMVWASLGLVRSRKVEAPSRPGSRVHSQIPQPIRASARDER